MFFKKKPRREQPCVYNPPPSDVKRPEKPTPTPPAKLYDKLGRLTRRKGTKAVFVYDREVVVDDVLRILVLMGRRDNAELTPEEEEMLYGSEADREAQ